MRNLAKCAVIKVVLLYLVITSLVAISVQTADATKEAIMNEQIVFRSDSEIFVANWQDRLSTLEQISLKHCLASPCLKNIIDVMASGNLLAILAINPMSEKFAIFLAELSTGTLENVIEADESHGMFYSIALSPDKQTIAFISGSASKSSPGVFDIVLFDRRGRQFLTLVEARASHSTNLSWHPSGEYLTFNSIDGWIGSVYLRDRHVEKIVSGETPAWSPDGNTLAYRKEKAIFLYNVARRNSEKLYGRLFWQSNFAGSMYWNSDGKYLGVNVHSGLLGYDHECLLIETTSARVLSSYSGSYPCGPIIRNMF
jgi:Tol biopolymer transport system component